MRGNFDTTWVVWKAYQYLVVPNNQFWNCMEIGETSTHFFHVIIWWNSSNRNHHFKLQISGVNHSLEIRVKHLFRLTFFFCGSQAILRIPEPIQFDGKKSFRNPLALAIFVSTKPSVFFCCFSVGEEIIEGTTSPGEYCGEKNPSPGSPFLDWKLGRWWFSPPTFEIMVFHSEFPTFLKNGGRSWTSRRYIFPMIPCMVWVPWAPKTNHGKIKVFGHLKNPGYVPSKKTPSSRWFKVPKLHPRSLEVTNNLSKRSRELTIPKRSRLESPGELFFSGWIWGFQVRQKTVSFMAVDRIDQAMGLRKVPGGVTG